MGAGEAGGERLVLSETKVTQSAKTELIGRVRCCILKIKTTRKEHKERLLIFFFRICLCCLSVVP